MSTRFVKTVEEFSAAGEELDGVLPVRLAALVAGVSRQRIRVLMESGRLECVNWSGWKLVGWGSLEKWIAERRVVKQATTGPVVPEVKL